mmetsp:Transcript_20085/g.49217  ORF Transcript_20085/g.49217 Transcript_20085/m.49217 type:complete len:212 (+) Transcript_20085:1434-2069(+)
MRPQQRRDLIIPLLACHPKRSDTVLVREIDLGAMAEEQRCEVGSVADRAEEERTQLVLVLCVRIRPIFEEPASKEELATVIKRSLLRSCRRRRRPFVFLRSRHADAHVKRGVPVIVGGVQPQLREAPKGLQPLQGRNHIGVPPAADRVEHGLPALCAVRQIGVQTQQIHEHLRVALRGGDVERSQPVRVDLAVDVSTLSKEELDESLAALV